MQSQAVPSVALTRLAGAAALVAVAVSCSLLAILESQVYGVVGLLLALLLGSLFIVMELRLSRAAGSEQSLAGLGELRGPAESVLESLLDPETSLPRVWLFLARLTEEIRRAQRYGRRLVLCVLKPEDPLVRLDEAYRGRVGRAVRGYLRGSDFATVGRSGRLLVLFPETVGPSAEWAARRLVKALDSLLREGNPRRWRAALVWYPDDGADASQLLRSAERLLAEQPVA